MGVCPGTPARRGVTWRGTGVLRALCSAHAPQVEHCACHAVNGSPESYSLLPASTDQDWLEGPIALPSKKGGDV
jgi:hypothetical protein